MFISKIGQTVFFWEDRPDALDLNSVPVEATLTGLRADEDEEQAYFKGYGWFDLDSVYGSQREAYDAAAQALVLQATEKIELAKAFKLRTLDLPEIPEELLLSRKAA